MDARCIYSSFVTRAVPRGHRMMNECSERERMMNECSERERMMNECSERERMMNECSKRERMMNECSERERMMNECSERERMMNECSERERIDALILDYKYINYNKSFLIQINKIYFIAKYKLSYLIKRLLIDKYINS